MQPEALCDLENVLRKLIMKSIEFFLPHEPKSQSDKVRVSIVVEV